MATDQEDEIAGFLFCAFEELDEAGRIQGAAGGVEKDLAVGSVFREKVKPVRDDFAHFAIRIAAGAFEKFGRHGVGVRITRLADVIEKQLHAFSMGVQYPNP